MVTHLKRDQLTPLSLWKQRNARWLALGVVVLAGRLSRGISPSSAPGFLRTAADGLPSTFYSFRVGRA